MTINIPLSPEVETALKQRAAAAGKDVAQFAREALEEKLSKPQSISEALQGIRQATAGADLNPEELDRVIEECRADLFAERQARGDP